jgi:hypothetical protein
VLRLPICAVKKSTKAKFGAHAVGGDEGRHKRRLAGEDRQVSSPGPLSVASLAGSEPVIAPGRIVHLSCRGGKRHKRDDIGEALKVGGIEGQQPADAVFQHGGDQVGVVHLLSGNRMSGEELQQAVEHG